MQPSSAVSDCNFRPDYLPKLQISRNDLPAQCVACGPADRMRGYGWPTIQESIPDHSVPGAALALSGGGYRAMVFHAGKRRSG